MLKNGGVGQTAQVAHGAQIPKSFPEKEGGDVAGFHPRVGVFASHPLIGVGIRPTIHALQNYKQVHRLEDVASYAAAQPVLYHSIPYEFAPILLEEGIMAFRDVSAIRKEEDHMEGIQNKEREEQEGFHFIFCLSKTREGAMSRKGGRILCETNTRHLLEFVRKGNVISTDNQFSYFQCLMTRHLYPFITGIPYISVFGDVVYENYQQDIIFSKREKFQHENEFRIAIQCFSPNQMMDASPSTFLAPGVKVIGARHIFMKLPSSCFRLMDEFYQEVQCQ